MVGNTVWHSQWMTSKDDAVYCSIWGYIVFLGAAIQVQCCVLSATAHHGQRCSIFRVIFLQKCSDIILTTTKWDKKQRRHIWISHSIVKSTRITCTGQFKQRQSAIAGWCTERGFHSEHELIWPSLYSTDWIHQQDSINSLAKSGILTLLAIYAFYQNGLQTGAYQNVNSSFTIAIWNCWHFHYPRTSASEV